MSLLRITTTMFIKLIRSYPKLTEDKQRKLDSDGNPITVFVYHVTGKDDDLDRYREIQEKNSVKTIEDSNGRLLWFTTRPVGKTGVLQISTNDKIYADTTAIDLAGAMIKQYGSLGHLMAKEILAEGIIAEEIPELEDKPAEGNGKLD